LRDGLPVESCSSKVRTRVWAEDDPHQVCGRERPQVGAMSFRRLS
jgi:hypothetical protein